MNMFATRPQGVRIPEGQGAERGAPKTVSHVIPVEWFAVQWFDEYGRAHEEISCRVGTTVYLAPNGEQWSAGLKRAAPWLTDHVNRELNSRKASVPESDSVDVMGGDDANDSPATK